MLSCPAVIGANPPHVNPIFFLTTSTNSSPDFLLNLPDSDLPNTTDFLPNLSASNASPTALSVLTLEVLPGLRFSRPTPVISLLTFLSLTPDLSSSVVLLKVYVLSVLEKIPSSLFLETLLLNINISVAF